MKPHRSLLWLGVLALLAAALPPKVSPNTQQPLVVVLTYRGPVTPVMVRYLDQGLDQAQRQQAEALVLQLDTPGGAVSVMQEVIQRIRSSPVPVVVYVAPRGATAASAGSLILLAAHVAAMAPETTLGAAAPVGPDGEDLGSTLKAKATNLLAAMARSLARRRGPKAMEVAQRLVTEAYALPEDEALRIGLIDVVAEDLPDLLRQLDGRRVETVDGSHTLHTANAQIQTRPMGLLNELLSLLSNPNVVFLLLFLGVQFLLIEIGQPGGWVAGFIGVVLLVLSLYGLGTLPVNWLGLALIAIAFVLFILELKTPGWQGGLIAAGGITFIVGALLLFNTPQALPFQRVSVPLVVGTGVVLSAVALLLVGLAVRAQQRPVVTGPEHLRSTLIGRQALTRTRITDLEPGTVYVAGELWTAELPPGTPPVEPDTWVEVVDVRGSRLIVRPYPQGEPDVQ